MARKNWNYSTKRNRLENNFYQGFKNEGWKQYNSTIIKKYFINEGKLTEWERKFYTSMKEQEFNFTDKQFDVIIKIYNKYK